MHNSPTIRLTSQGYGVNQIKETEEEGWEEKLNCVYKAMGGKNSLKKEREALLMSKAELAREANVSPITISRIEKGLPCRMETKRKILLALGMDLSEKNKIFRE